MPVGHRMITVQTPRHRIELLVPNTITAAELVPELLELVGDDVVSHRSAEVPSAGSWGLLRPGGEPMPVDQPMVALGVRNGDSLLLVPDGQEFRPPRILPALIGADQGATAAWDHSDTRTALLLAALTALAASVLVTTDHGPPDFRTMLVVAGLCSLAAIVVGRIPQRGVFRAWVSLSLALTGGLLVIGSAFAALTTGPGDGVAAPVGILAAAVLVAAGIPVLAVGSPAARAVALAGAVAGLPALMVAVVGTLTSASQRTMAAVIVVVAALLLRKGAAVAVALHGLLLDRTGRRARHGKPDLPSWWAIQPSKDAAARAALMAIIIGCASALLLAGMLLITGTALERWILAACVAILVAQPRWLRFRRHRITATVVAAAGIALLVVPALRELHSPSLRVALLGLSAVLLLALTARRRRWPRMPWLARAGEVVEVLAVMALVPLLADQLGMFAVADRLVHRWIS